MEARYMPEVEHSVDRNDRMPLVSVVVAMLNEEEFIEVMLEAVDGQTWDKSHLELIIVDSGSTDMSRSIVDAWIDQHPWCRVVPNPDRQQSSAWRRGIEAARGEIVCCINAHGLPASDYVERSVAVLKESGAVAAGGVILHEGMSKQSTAIGLAMASPFGMASPHRFAKGRREVDTLSHPAFVRSAVLDVGLHDESLERNEDYELNWRLRRAGGTLIFDESIVSTYRPRASLMALWRQFWWYGESKVEVVRRHPRSLKLRHTVPPATVSAGFVLVVLSWNSRVRRLMMLAVVSYVGIVGLAFARHRPRSHDADEVTFGLAFPVMHAAWGAGFLSRAVKHTVAGTWHYAPDEAEARRALTSESRPSI
jgi:succinoglycan biosynthesis protein ExoA